MKTTTKTPDAFGSLLAALQAIYEVEIARLADLYQPRILAGEFSGHTGIDTWTKQIGPEQGDPRHMRLEGELQKAHPWLATKRGRLAVVAVSRWTASGRVVAEQGAPENALGDSAAECMGHDIMALAAERGWVDRYREKRGGPYTLRVA